MIVPIATIIRQGNSSNHEKYEINSKAVQEPAGQLCKLLPA